MKQTRFPGGEALGSGWQGKPGSRRREPPPAETHAEAYFFNRQVETRTTLVVHLRDGAILEGTLAWYDRGAFRLDREDGSHVVVQKTAVSFLHER